MTPIGPIEGEELRWTTDQLHNVLLVKEIEAVGGPSNRPR